MEPDNLTPQAQPNPVEVPVQPAPVQPVDNNYQPEHGSRKFIAVLGVIVLLLLVGGGAYYLGTMNGRTSANLEMDGLVAQNNVVDTSIPTVTNAPQQNETANWEMYSNEVWDFSFQYPFTFMINDNLPSTTSLSDWGADKKIELVDEQNGRNLSFWIPLDGFGPFFADIGYTEMGYSESQGLYVVEETRGTSEYPTEGKKMIITKQGFTVAGYPHPMFFIFTYLEDDSEAEEIFKEILSTFRLGS